MTVSISVIVPTFNAATTLERCLESLTAQTYPLQEILVIDDGSTDQSASIAERFAQRHRTVSVQRHQNSGVSSARNHGLNLATSDFIGFVDPDDHVHPGMYGVLLRAALESGSQMAALRQNTILDAPVPSALEGPELIHAQEALSRLLELRYPASVCAHLYSRQALHGLRFDRRVSFFEDLLFNFHALRRVERVPLVDGIWYFYEPGPSGANRGPMREGHLSAFTACATMRETIARESLSLWPQLAFLEAHCLVSMVYKAITSPRGVRIAKDSVQSFARLILPECGVHAVGARRRLLIVAAAFAPGALLSVARTALILRRVVSRACGVGSEH